jgi:O-acetyl-ADP-ribose deacetylase (regulator of RNase III)
MIFKEEKRDLFSVTEDYYLAHCISADFGMGKGIVVEFNKRFDLKNKLITEYPSYIKTWDAKYEEDIPCILEGRVFNLITKRNYWNKPTYTTFENALIAMKCLAQLNGVNKIAMPKIGCGLDKLQWDKVKEIITNIFDDTDIEVLVCYV